MIVALGDLMMDITIHADCLIPQSEHCSGRAAISPGGSAANFAVWAARLGAQVGLIAKVGRDVLGRSLLDDLQRERVINGVAVGDDTTGLFLIIVDAGGRRTLLATRGATATLSRDDLDWNLLNQAELLHVTAYSFLEEAPRQAALAAMRHVKGRGGWLSLDPCSHGYLQQVGAEAFLAMTEGVDLFFPNWDEAHALTGDENPERIVRALLKNYPLVVLKLGQDGAMAGAGDAVIHQPGLSVPVVDTVGAGDAFAAAFVVTWLAGHDLAAALREGNRIAAGVVQAAGTRATATPPAS